MKIKNDFFLCLKSVFEESNKNDSLDVAMTHLNEINWSK